MSTTIEDLIPVLWEKTKAGKIMWEALSGPSFIARVNTIGVEVLHTREGFARMSLRDEQGRLLESIDIEQLASPLDRKLDELYDMARRQALKVDDVLGDVKAALDRL
ncbi:MAG TPA: hypothetical protein VII40_18715 [Xanthobacteraceae bacterium]|jgi:hypothetical protein